MGGLNTPYILVTWLPFEFLSGGAGLRDGAPVTWVVTGPVTGNEFREFRQLPTAPPLNTQRTHLPVSRAIPPNTYTSGTRNKLCLVPTTPTPLELEILPIARSYLFVRETDGPNDSPDIRQWLAHVGIKKPAAYCAAFCSWCVYAASGRVPCTPAFRPSAGALRLLERNPGLLVAPADAPALLADGHPLIFVQDHGKGLGHAGLAIATVDGTTFNSIEANTGPGPAVAAKDRDGQGVFARHDRRFDGCLGFLKVA